MALQSPFFNKREENNTGVRTTSPNAAAASGQQTGIVAATVAPATVAANTPARDGESKLTVGPNIKLKGVEITDCDTLVVEGHVEATMDSRAIQIAQSGTFSGNAGIDVAEIHGSFTGELTVRKRLVIHSTGKVSGTVRYGKLVIEEGGEISGDVKTLAQGQPGLASSTTTTTAKPAPVQPAFHH